jgi:hypothetical protein
LKDVKRYTHAQFVDEDSLSKNYRNMKPLIFQAIKMEEVQELLNALGDDKDPDDDEYGR